MVTDNYSTRTIHGMRISPGLAQGLTHVYLGLLGPIDASVAIDKNIVGEEFSRLDAATERITEDLLVFGVH